MIEVKNNLHDRYLNCPAARNKTAFTDLRREVQREVTGIENDWRLRYANEMQSFFDTGDVNNFYNSLKVAIGPSDRSLTPVRANRGDLREDKAAILSRWIEHFSKLLNKVKPADLSFLHAILRLSIIEKLDLQPTLTEVKN